MSIVYKIIYVVSALLGSATIYAQNDAKTLLTTFQNKRLPDSIRIAAADGLQMRYTLSSPDSLLLLAASITHLEGQLINADWDAVRHMTLGRYYITHSALDTASTHYNKADSLLPYIQSSLLKAVIHGGRGYLNYIYSGDGPTALQDFQKAEQILLSLKDYFRLPSIYMYKGVIYFDSGNYFDAATHFLEGIKLAEQVGRKDIQYNLMVNMGLVLNSLGLEEEARAYLQKALIATEGTLNKQLLRAQIFSYLIGMAENMDYAHQYYSEGLKLSTKPEYKWTQMNLNYELSSYFLKFDMLDSARLYLKIVEKLSKEANDSRVEENIRIQKAIIEVRQSPRLSNIVQLESLVPLKTQKVSVLLIDAYATLSNAYRKMGLWERALYYQDQKLNAEESLKGSNMLKKVVARYFTEQANREKSIMALENEKAVQKAMFQISRQKYLLIFGTTALFLLVIVILALFNNAKNKSRSAQILESTNRALHLEKDRLLIKNQQLQRFANVISHDILSNIDLIISTGNVLVGPQLKTENLSLYYEKTQQTSHQLKQYCLNLLKEAKTSQQSATQPTDTMSIVRTILGRFDQVLRDTGSKVLLEDLSPTFISPVLTEQVFQNLISNALRHGSTAVAPILRITAEKDNFGCIYWIVEDNGKGVSPEQKEYIFHGKANSDQGNGLGLSLLRSALREQGADIWVEERIGGGARFVVKLRSA